tara:strand:+ start:229 stop:645 length:417 start_codon:yes stop_codon:yes gene_type:complete
MNDLYDELEDENVEKINYSDIRLEAKLILQKASRMPTQWLDIFNSIEMFRKKVQAGRDKYDATANDAQVGLMSPMLIMFALMLETNMTMEPLDTNIIINVLSDNFKEERHIKTLKSLLHELHPEEKEFLDENKKYGNR